MPRTMFLLLLLPMALGQTSLRGTELKLTTVSSNYELYIKSNNLSSGERYEGFLVDMLKELSTMLGFTFTIHENPTGAYGSINDEGNWTGMIAEVASGAADMALADMTITAKREEAVDFTHPFLHIGLGVLGYKGGAPRSLQELADDDSVRVGTFCCGSIAAGLNKSSDPLLQRIWAKIQENPETYSNIDGIDKVLANRGGYAFVISSDLVDYQVARNCQFTQIGKMFWPRGGYGLALASGSPYREELNQGILRMQEMGRMEMLYKKWISQQQGSQCDSKQPGLIGWLSGML